MTIGISTLLVKNIQNNFAETCKIVKKITHEKNEYKYIIKIIKIVENIKIVKILRSTAIYSKGNLSQKKTKTSLSSRNCNLLAPKGAAAKPD